MGVKQHLTSAFYGTSARRDAVETSAEAFILYLYTPFSFDFVFSSPLPPFFSDSLIFLYCRNSNTLFYFPQFSIVLYHLVRLELRRAFDVELDTQSRHPQPSTQEGSAIPSFLTE